MTKSNNRIFSAIIIVVVLMLLISACDRKPKDDHPITDMDFRKGTDGLEIDFIQNGPPELLMENSEFQIIARVYNKGAYDTTNVYVTAGVENDYMCILTEELDSEGKKKCAKFSEEDLEKIKQIKENRVKLPALNLKLAVNETQLELAQKEEKKEEDKIEYTIETDPDLMIPKITNLGAKITKLTADVETTKKEIADIQENIKTLESSLELINKYLTQSTGRLRGKSISFPDGSFEDKKYNARTDEIDALSEKHTSTVALTACYEYSTELGDNICIDPDIYGTSTLNKVCSIKDLSHSGQGSPVAITRIETKIIPHGSDKVRLQLIIHIKNKGKGNIIKAGKVKHACSASGLHRDDWNSIELSQLRVSSKYVYDSSKADDKNPENDENAFVCKRQPIKLENNEGEITCTLKDEHAILKTDPAFTTQIFAKLKYGYTFSESKDVVIEKPVIY